VVKLGLKEGAGHGFVASRHTSRREVEPRSQQRALPRLLCELYSFFASISSTIPASFINSPPNVIGSAARLRTISS
jgi:hypothetical protein